MLCIINGTKWCSRGFKFYCQLRIERENMQRNVEIKAVVRNKEEIIKLAEQLSGSQGEILCQEDIFFKVPQGRLKLRKLNEQSELIYYQRPDASGPKMSELVSADVVNWKDTSALLDLALGRVGVLRKKRLLYFVGQTRIHIDEVENLGNFMELEVVLNSNQTLENGTEIANDLQKKLNVANEDLLAGAYIDMLLEK